MTEYEAMHDELNLLAPEGCALGRTGDLRVRPDGWDSNAFCTNLSFARHGKGIGMDRHAESIKAGFMLVSSTSSVALPRSRTSIQREFYRILQSFETCDWIATVHKKVRAWVPDLSSNWSWASAECGALRQVLSKSELRVSMCVLKSIANAWTTSTRMHEDVCLPCILGCQAADSLAHYICCDPLWTVVTSCAGAGTDMLRRPAISKLCLSAPSPEGARLLAIAFHCYHALKLGHRALIDCAFLSDDFEAVWSKLWSLAGVYSSDIGR